MFVYEKVGERFLRHFTGSGENEVIRQTLKWCDEFVKFDQGKIVGSFCRLSGVVFCHTSQGWSAFVTTSDQSTANLQPRYGSRSTSGVYTNATVTRRE